MEYSFRGKYGPELVRRVADTIHKIGFQGVVVIARDSRPSSHALASLIVSGLLQNGNIVHDIGVVPTPVLSYYSKQHSCLGVMVTASHNPEDDNGIKMFFNGSEASNIQPNHSINPSSKIIVADAAAGYIPAVLKYIDTSAIQRVRPKVVVDCGNGTAGAFTPLILRAAGARVITVDAEISHPFSRSPEPEYDTLAYLPAIVREMGAAFAVAHDADADRCRIVTADGVMPQDIQLLNIASAICKKGDLFVTTVEASQAVLDQLAKIGIRTEITPVGSNHVARAAARYGAKFGGEPCGEYVFPDFLLSADGVLSALVLTKIYCELKGFTAYNQYPIIRGKIAVSPNIPKYKIIEKVKGALRQVPSINIVSEQDGILFNYEGARVLVRCSNTQDIIRITCEHADENRARQAYDWIKKVIVETTHNGYAIE
ncbi:MAG: hypothetical protein QW500_01195 [Candidatus Micrarchaeia archaeon]